MLAQDYTRETATGDPVYGRNQRATKSREQMITGVSWLIFAYPWVEPESRRPCQTWQNVTNELGWVPEQFF